MSAAPRLSVVTKPSGRPVETDTCGAWQHALIVEDPGDAEALRGLIPGASVWTIDDVEAADGRELAAIAAHRLVLLALPGDAGLALRARALDAVGRLEPHADEVNLVSWPSWTVGTSFGPPAGIDSPGSLLVWLRSLPEVGEVEAEDEDEKSKVRAAAPVEHALTDLGNARRLIQHHGINIRYCYDWKTWLVYSTGRWNRDRSGMVQSFAKKVSDYVLTELPPGSDREKVLAFKVWAQKSQSAKAIRDMMELARSDVPVNPEHFDSDPLLLNVRNGTVHLPTGELRPHRREDLITKQCPVDYDPDAKAPRFERFEQEVFAGDDSLVRYMRRASGYAVSGLDEVHEINILHGSGRNGKNVYLDVFRSVLGDYATQAEPNLLLSSNSDAHPTGQADLQGRRFVSTSETDDGKRLAEALVKRFTGDATIKARRMNQDFFEFARTFKLFLATNFKPIIKGGGDNDAIWDRVRLIPFGVKFVRPEETVDPPMFLPAEGGLDKRLIAEESAGILAILVRGFREWRTDGMQPPQAVLAATESYRHEMDLIGDFLDERCNTFLDHPTLREQAKAKATELYQAYAKWTESNGLHAMNSRKFGAEMERRGFTLHKSHSVCWRLGLSLNTEGQDVY